MSVAGVEKVVHLDAPRLANGTLGTSKIQQIHWRGDEFQLFTLFSLKPLFDRFWSSRRLILEAFWYQFWEQQSVEKRKREMEAKRGSTGPITTIG